MKKLLSMALIALMAVGTVTAFAGENCSKCDGKKGDKKEKADSTKADSEKTDESASA